MENIDKYLIDIILFCFREISCSNFDVVNRQVARRIPKTSLMIIEQFGQLCESTPIEIAQRSSARGSGDLR